MHQSDTTNKADAAEREAFEAHILAQPWCKPHFVRRHSADRPTDFAARYIHPQVEEYWSIWQARAALSASPTSSDREQQAMKLLRELVAAHDELSDENRWPFTPRARIRLALHRARSLVAASSNDHEDGMR